MATITDVINDALSEIGANTIASPNEQTEQARRANFLFPRVVRTELRRHAWSFAMDRGKLPATGVVPAFGFALQYTLPADFLRLWTINDDYAHVILHDYVGSNLAPYAIEGGAILTNYVAPLKIRYIKDVGSQVNTWDAMFRDVIALKLGQKLVPSLTKSDSKYQLLGQQYKEALGDAKRINAIELPSIPMADDSWSIGRF